MWEQCVLPFFPPVCYHVLLGFFPPCSKCGFLCTSFLPPSSSLCYQFSKMLDPLLRLSYGQKQLVLTSSFSPGEPAVVKTNCSEFLNPGKGVWQRLMPSFPLFRTPLLFTRGMMGICPFSNSDQRLVSFWFDKEALLGQSCVCTTPHPPYNSPPHKALSIKQKNGYSILETFGRSSFALMPTDPFDSMGIVLLNFLVFIFFKKKTSSSFEGGSESSGAGKTKEEMVCKLMFSERDSSNKRGLCFYMHLTPFKPHYCPSLHSSSIPVILQILCRKQPLRRLLSRRID